MPKKDPTQLAHAKAMRSEMTEPEQRLWYRLRGKRLADTKFTRQVLIGPYIADFAARDAGLVIELDGDSHASQVAYDERRTAAIAAAGFRVIRFTNAEVMGNMEGVLETIMAALGGGRCVGSGSAAEAGSETAPLPNPLPGGERGLSSSLSPPGRGPGRGAVTAPNLTKNP